MMTIYLIEVEKDDGYNSSYYEVDVDYGAYTSREAAQKVVDSAAYLQAKEEQKYRKAVNAWNAKRAETLEALKAAGVLTGVSLDYNDYPRRSEFIHTSKLLVSGPVKIVE